MTKSERSEDADVKRHAKRGRFKFSMVNIKVGEYVVFSPTNLKVKVASDDSIEYEGRIYKLSPFVGTFLPEEKKNASNAYQGSKYFTYNGKILDDLRKQMENSQMANDSITDETDNKG